MERRGAVAVRDRILAGPLFDDAAVRHGDDPATSLLGERPMILLESMCETNPRMKLERLLHFYLAAMGRDGVGETMRYGVSHTSSPIDGTFTGGSPGDRMVTYH